MKKESLDNYIPTEVIVPDIDIFTNNVVDINELRERKESKNKVYLDILENAINKVDW